MRCHAGSKFSLAVDDVIGTSEAGLVQSNVGLSQDGGRSHSLQNGIGLEWAFP